MKKRTLEGSEIAGSSKKQMVLSTRQLNALRELKNWHQNEFTGRFYAMDDPTSDMETLQELCEDASIEYTLCGDVDKWIEYDRKCGTIQKFLSMEKTKQKGQVWMWLFEIFEEYDGRGANGDCADIEVLIKDKKKVKEAAKYGWIDVEEDELYLEPEVESMEMEVLTEDFYSDLECVTDEEFLKKWKDELKELRQIFEGSGEEDEEDSEEDE